MARPAGARHRLSDLQWLIVANLREQAKLEAELARIDRSTTLSQRIRLAPHIARLTAELIALGAAMNLRRRQESGLKVTANQDNDIRPSSKAMTR